LVIKYRVPLKRESSYLRTREGLALFGVFLAGFSFVLFAFGSISFGTPLALVGIIVILREVFAKHDIVLEGAMPRGVTAVAAISILGGANLVLGGVGSIISPPAINEPDLVGITLPAEILALISTILLVLAVVALVLGSLKILTGLVLRSGRSWAWALGIASSVSSIFLDASSLGVNTSVLASSIELPTSVVAIVYLTRPYVRAFYKGVSASQTQSSTALP
jgi:FtsH-binding integral membrane protein